jgi:hypothetical protein
MPNDDVWGPGPRVLEETATVPRATVPLALGLTGAKGYQRGTRLEHNRASAGSIGTSADRQHSAHLAGAKGKKAPPMQQLARKKSPGRASSLHLHWLDESTSSLYMLNLTHFY